MTCKPVRIKGKMRKLCWGMTKDTRMVPVITSNTAIGGGKKKAKKAKKATKRKSTKKRTAKKASAKKGRGSRSAFSRPAGFIQPPRPHRGGGRMDGLHGWW